MVAVGTAASFVEAQYQPLTPSKPSEGYEELRERFQAEGYLYFPRVLDSSIVQPVLEDMLSVLSPHIHWSSAAASPVLAGDPFFESDPLWDRLYPKVQALESLHRIFHCCEVRRLMDLVAGPDVFVYPMKMARIAAPRKLGFETPPHQDAFSHHAGPTMAGIWIALHDADEAMGRLTILPGSHMHGVRPVFEAQGVGGVQCEIHPEETLWHVSNVTAGDVIIFHSQTVHRAQANVDKHRVRLSVDSRFCDYGAPVFSTNLEPHHAWRIPELDWDYVYRDWKTQDLRHYWLDYPGLF
ncbi:phytanoyl-CoA dioxygenase family protein [Congregibacter variabilis]|uniref:Phytanoyl-CoA dioxygenase family protein n=1 Tax=Congregibacter variabilis TaxID=3081200 RepID=A0ABZ0I6I4_9GAMM|nr:phytanoyl-CoA dioxygenase family protein [Congregibacter sp. IMCC43200]